MFNLQIMALLSHKTMFVQLEQIEYCLLKQQSVDGVPDLSYAFPILSHN